MSLALTLAKAALLAFLFLNFVAAHQSGCHAWHSCPSDRGTYECGDIGYCNYCPDNVYCLNGESRLTANAPSNAGQSTATSGRPPQVTTNPEEVKQLISNVSSLFEENKARIARNFVEETERLLSFAKVYSESGYYSDAFYYAEQARQMVQVGLSFVPSTPTPSPLLTPTSITQKISPTPEPTIQTTIQPAPVTGQVVSREIQEPRATIQTQEQEIQKLKQEIQELRGEQQNQKTLLEKIIDFLKSIFSWWR